MIEPRAEASVRIDLRQLDSVSMLDDGADDTDHTLESEKRERQNSIVLGLDELEIALYIADGRDAALQIVRAAEVWVGGGTRESKEQSSEPATVQANEALDAKLVILSSFHPDDAAGKEDRLAGTVFDLVWPEATVGRTDENSIVIDHRSVSRTHARLTRDATTGRYTIHEVSPTANGVRVNGKDVTSVGLAHRDIVDLGHVRMRYIQTDAGRWPEGPPVPERFVLVDGVPVLFDGQFIRIGTLSFRVNEVSEYAQRGANIPLHKGALVQAAVTLLVAVAAGWEVHPLEFFGITFATDERRIEDVEADSPGAAAGARAGDEVNGLGAASAILYPDIGDHLVLRLQRNGEEIHVRLRPEDPDDLPKFLNRAAPSFTATAREERISLTELVGCIVLLYFCDPDDEVCKAGLEQLAALCARHPDLRVVAIDCVGVDGSNSEDRGVAIVQDDDDAISEAYEGVTTPTSVVIDYDGIVRKIEQGYPSFQRLEAELIALMKPTA